MERESLWRKVAVSHFSLFSEWKSKGVYGRYGCGMWKSIQKMNDIFWKFIHLKVGSGREIRFWEDKWVSERPLKESFRILYSTAFDPLDMVVDSFDVVGNI